MFNHLLAHIRKLLERMSMCLADPRPRGRMIEVGLGLLCGDVPKTITSAIEWNGAQGDWSADYRLFSKTSWELDDLFKPILGDAVVKNLDGPIYAAMDDTLVRKTGRKIPGTAYARDTLSPAFHINLVLGQRFLQTTVMARASDDRPWRSIPVAFRHVPPLKAPARATEEQKRAVKEARKIYNMSTVGRDELAKLRANIDSLPNNRTRHLIMTVDGSFANRSFLTEIPQHTTAVARIRKNARLRAAMPQEKRTGNRKYGELLPTPEQMLKDPAIPTQTAIVSVSGRRHVIRYKVIENVCWPRTTRDKPATLVLLKPLGYRLRKGSKLLYKQPGYLFVTGAPADIVHIIQAYLLRWEIEVNFRDEKTILGAGKAQVWNPRSVARAPAFLVACYAAMLLSSMTALNDRRNEQFDPLSPWRLDNVSRPSTRDLVRLLRKQITQGRKHPETEIRSVA
jgi:SRSO17 transposase